MSDEWLKQRLESAVPPPPVAPDRVRGVAHKRRSHSRRMVIGTVVGAAALVAAIAVPAAMIGSSGSSGVAPANGSGVHGEVTPCPADPITQETTTGPSRLSDGAVWMRICVGPENRIDPPADVITTDVGAVGGLINTTMESTEDSTFDCDAELGDGWGLLIGYPDGRTQQVAGQNYGCGLLDVGDKTGAGALEVWQAVLDRLWSQRRHEPAPIARGRPTCAGDFRTDVVADPSTIDRAVACLQGDDRQLTVRLDSDEIDILAHDWLTSTTQKQVDDCAWPGVTIRGITTWNESTTLIYACGAWNHYKDQVSTAAGVTEISTLPGDSAQALLDKIVAQASSTGSD